MKVPEKALSVLRSRFTADVDAGDAAVVHPHRPEMIKQQTNPNDVADPTWKLWGPEAKARRQAVQLGLEARLTIFRDNIEAVRTGNRVLNNAAVVQIMTAAENFIVQVRSVAEVEKQKILDDAQTDLLQVLRSHLMDLDDLRQQGGIPPQLLDVRCDSALNEYAERSVKIAGLDFEFDKTRLLDLSEDGGRAKEKTSNKRSRH